MIIIKNSKELAKLVNEHKDLIVPGEDVRIEFEPSRDEIRNVECRNLYLENDDEKFDFNGRDFNGVYFNGRDFNGRDFNGVDFNGRDFNGWDFNGRDFNGKKVSYYAFFNCYGYCKCTEIEGRRDPHAEPVCLNGKLEIVKEEPEEILIKDGKKYRVRILEELD